MKFFYLFIIFLSLNIYGQAQISEKQSETNLARPFCLTFTKYNHAERLYKGTLKYVMTESYIKVISIPFLEKKEKTIFFKSLSKFTKSVIQISTTNLNSLKSNYFNYCIMYASGDEYTLDFKNKLSSKSMTLHHYYLEKVEAIIKLINENLPGKYQIYYLAKETKQDCTS